MLEITEHQTHDSMEYIERIESEIQRRIEKECAIKGLKTVMNDGRARDLEVLQEKYQISQRQIAWTMINELVETCPIENLRWFFGNLVPVDSLAPYGHQKGYTLLASRIRDFGCCWEIEGKEVQAIRNLIDLGADIHVTTPAGDTLLHLAASCYCGSDFPKLIGIIELLLDLGLDINAQNLAGKTALMCACDPNVADYLIRQPACNLGHRKWHNSVVIKKNNFKKTEVYKACEKLGGMAVAMSRIQERALDGSIPSPTKTTDRPNLRAIEM